MNLRDEIEALVTRDNQMTTHHLDVHRVEPQELHPVRIDHEKLSKSRSSYKARAVVEDFHATVNGVTRRPIDSVTETTNERSASIASPVLMEAEGIRIHECSVDERGIVKVVCSADSSTYNLPVYLVNPPLLVEDELGDIAVPHPEQDGPILLSENPTAALFEALKGISTNESGVS